MPTIAHTSAPAAVKEGPLSAELSALTREQIEEGLGKEVIRVIADEGTPESADLITLLARIYETPSAFKNLMNGVESVVSFLKAPAARKPGLSGRATLLSFLSAGIYLGYRLAWLQMKAADRTN